MRERLDRLERRVEELAKELEALSLFVHGALPGGVVPTTRPGRGRVGVGGAPSEAEEWTISREIEALVAKHGLVFLAGLVSLVLAGAMVLRVVTISAPIPIVAAAGFGVGYCALLLILAERKLRAGATLHGDTYAILSVLILDALLVEATHRHGGPSPELSYGVLGLSLVLISLLSFSRARMAPFAAALGAAPFVGLAIAGRPFLYPWFAGLLGLCLLLSLVAGHRLSWHGTRWWPAVASLVFLAILSGIAGAVARRNLPEHVYARPPWALALFAVFFLLLTAFPAVASLAGQRRFGAFEAFCSVGGAITCFGGVAAVLTARPGGALLVGWMAAVMAILFYAAAAVSFKLKGAESGSFSTHAAIGLLAALAAFPSLLGLSPVAAAAAEAFALALAFFAERHAKKSLSFQAHVLTFLAAAVLLFSSASLSPPGTAAAESRMVALWFVVTGVLATAVFERLRSFVPPDRRFRLERLTAPALALVLVFACGIFEVLLGMPRLVFPSLSSALGFDASPVDRVAAWQTLLTLSLMAGGFVTLVAGMRLVQGELVLLAVGLFLIAGLKLGLYDAFHVPGAYFVVSAALFGVALLSSSVLYRKSRGLAPTRGGSDLIDEGGWNDADE